MNGERWRGSSGGSRPRAAPRKRSPPFTNRSRSPTSWNPSTAKMSHRLCRGIPFADRPATAGRDVQVQVKGERCEGPPQEEPPWEELPFARNREIPVFSVRPPQAGHASSFPASDRRRYDSNCCPQSRHLKSYSGIVSHPLPFGHAQLFQKGFHQAPVRPTRLEQVHPNKNGEQEKPGRNIPPQPHACQ